jgi:hypothetical protein
MPEETWSAGGRLCCQRRSSSSSSGPLSKCSQKLGSPAMCMLCAMRLTTCPQSRRRLLDETALALRWAQCGGGSTGSCGLAAALARKVSAPLCVGRREHRRNSGTFTDYLESITSISRAPICSSDSIGKLNAEPASLTSSPRGKRSAIHSRLAVEIHEDWIEP